MASGEVAAQELLVSALMSKQTLAIISILAVAACTGGDMGTSRGAGAPPGQSGGRDTTAGGANTAAPAGGRVGASAATTRAGVDTNKQAGAAKGSKRP